MIPAKRNTTLFVLLTLCFPWGWTTRAFAQEENFISYNEKYGLNRSYINSMARDSSGLYWLATEKGVVRFDGANFTEITARPELQMSMAVARVKVSGHHLLIVYESGKLQRLNLQTYQTEALPNAPAYDAVQLNGQEIIVLQRDGWLVRYKDGVALQRRQIANGLPKDQSQIYLWHGKLLVVVPDIGAFWLDPNDLRTISFPMIDLGTVSLRFSEYGGNLLVFTAGKAFSIDKDHRVTQLRSPDKKDPFSTYFVSFVSPRHYYYIQRNKRIMEVIGDSTHQVPLPGLGNVELRMLYQQDSTHILVATNQGLLQVRDKSTPVTHLQEPDRVRQTDIRIRRKVLPWLENKWVMLGFPNAYFYEPVDSFRSVVPNLISSYDGLLVGNELFMTSEGSGLIHVNLQHPKFNVIEQPPFNRVAAYIGIFRQQDSDTLLVGAMDSIYAYNVRSKQASSLWGTKGVGYVKTIFFDSAHHRYWIGTENGLFQLDANFRTIRELTQSPNGLSGKGISDLLIDRRSGLLWVSHENGVDIVDRNNGRIVNRMSTDVLSNPKVVTMLQDAKGRIWMATYGGITGYDPLTKTYIQLGRENGLINSEFNYKSAAVLPDGRLIFGGLDGYDIVQPSAFNFSVVKPQGQVTGYEKISSTDTTFYPPPGPNGKGISFDTDKELLRIYLSAKDIPNSAQYRFEYNLDDENWIKVKGSPFINLYNLAPRKYVMHIRGFNEYGILVDFPPLTLEARESFLKSRALLLSILSIAALFLGLYVTVLLTRRKREKELKEKIAMDLHDEVGTILTRTLYLTRAANSREDKTRVEQFLNEALYSLRAYIHTMNRSTFTLAQLRDEIIDLLQSTFRTAGYDVDINITVDQAASIDAELYRDIKLSVYEIMTNTIRHAGGDHFSFTLKEEQGMLYLSTCDNGKLVDAAVIQDKGNGVRNLIKRVKRHRGAFRFAVCSEGHGLLTHMSIPLHS